MPKFLYSCFFILVLFNPLFAEEPADENGAALYSSGDYAGAAAWYLSQPQDRKTKAVNYYNAARCYHQDYFENQNPESLEKAVDGYYRVLDMNPGMKEARMNLELARREQEENQKNRDFEQNGTQNQSGDQKDQDKGDQSLSDMADEQKDLSESDSSEENRRKQESLKQQTEKSLEDSENQDQKEALEKAIEKQKEALEKMQQKKDQEARDAQKSAAEYIEKASNLEGSKEDQNPLSQDLQTLLNQEQRRKKDEQEPDEFNQVERNW